MFSFSLMIESIFLLVCSNLWIPPALSTMVFIGTGSGSGRPTDSKGVYAFVLDEVKSTLTPLGLVGETANPTYIAIHPSQKYLYAANAVDNGTISAFVITSPQSGRLRLINQQLSHGSGPVYLSTNRAGDYIFVANYGSATVALLPINTTNGALQPATSFDQQTGSSIDPDRQTSAHAHCILLDHREEYALSADLGSDQIYHYRFSPNNGSLVRSSITRAAKLGDGPRHLVFSSNEKYVYLINELKSEITVFNYLPTMEPIQIISTLPENFTSTNTAAEILLHPKTEKFLYASNRGHDSIAVFSVETTTGFLSLIQHIGVQGQTPRNFNISPDGKFLIVANQDSNNLVLFTIDEQTGRLTATGSSAQISQPTCVKYLVQE